MYQYDSQSFALAVGFQWINPVVWHYRIEFFAFYTAGTGDANYNHGHRTPDLLAQAIHDQMDGQSCSVLPVPLEAVAAAHDIVNIRREPLSNIEGALVMTDNRHSGAILVNADGHPRRQRFTIAHELGHYLNLWHRQTAKDGFWCSRSNMEAAGFDRRMASDRNTLQEMQANRFAIALLIPDRFLLPKLTPCLDIQHVREIANLFECSLEATIRRIVALTSEPVAVVFSKDGRCRYWLGSDTMPRLTLRKGDWLPVSCMKGPDTMSISPIEAQVSSEGWLHPTNEASVIVEHHSQSRGYGVTLIKLDRATGLGNKLADMSEDECDEEDTGGMEDVFTRFSRFSD